MLKPVELKVDNKLLHVRKNHYSDILKEVISAKVLPIGSPYIAVFGSEKKSQQVFSRIGIF